MQLNDELIIQTKTRDMMKYGFICLRQFPKNERFILCADIRRSMYSMLRLTVVASKRYHKKTTIQDLDIELSDIKPVLSSYMGCATHANAYNLINNVLSVPFTRGYENAEAV